MHEAITCKYLLNHLKLIYYSTDFELKAASQKRFRLARAQRESSHAELTHFMLNLSTAVTGSIQAHLLINSL